MQYSENATIDALLPYETFRAADTLQEAQPTTDLANGKDPRVRADYSEEAIPERDPAYHLSDGTLSETLTVEHMTATKRLALIRCLEQFGMSRARAVAVASL
jgi:hypothetical protein